VEWGNILVLGERVSSFLFGGRLEAFTPWRIGGRGPMMEVSLMMWQFSTWTSSLPNKGWVSFPKTTYCDLKNIPPTQFSFFFCPGPFCDYSTVEFKRAVL
jgi:hypothetical protein